MERYHRFQDDVLSAIAGRACAVKNLAARVDSYKSQNTGWKDWCIHTMRLEAERSNDVERPDVEAMRRTLNRRGPHCDDFKGGSIRDLKTHLENAISYITHLESLSEWKPIDGAEIEPGYYLASWPLLGKYGRAVGEVFYIGGSINEWYAAVVQGETFQVFPTHYRPIPQPPKGGE